MTKEVLEQVFEDSEIKKLEEEKKKEELKLDIAKIKAETEKLCRNIDENKIQKKRSNYYEAASECKKIEKISISMTPQLRLLRVSAGAKGRKTRIVS